jgi:3-oxoacyl-[acyl-carrier protein] reductase
MAEGQELAGKELAGKVAIVTGAGRNIGRAIALHLAAAGASVVVNARSNQAEADAVVAEIKAAGGKAVAFLADVADPAAVEALAQATLTAFGRIDILVNNASLRREKPIDEMSYAEWREIMDATLDSAFHGVHACLPAMKKNGGAIINIGGMSAHIGSKGRAHVMTAKAGLIGFSRALAHDLGIHHITANCVVPGAIQTTRPRTSPNPAHHLTHGTITGEPGKPDDVAAMVRLLVGPGGRNVTGQTIHVNGGAFLG